MLQMTKCISIFPFRLYSCKLIEMINRCAIAMFLKRYFDQKVRGRITPSNRTDYKLNHRKKIDTQTQSGTSTCTWRSCVSYIYKGRMVVAIFRL